MQSLWCTAALLTVLAPTAAANFTRGERAQRYGTHEIMLTGSAGAANPFSVAAEVTFQPPSGRRVTVDAFYDGGTVWRARAYANEVGRWQWSSHCAADKALDGLSGSFTVEPSALRGMLRPHRQNSRAWMTDDGQWFLNLSDTAYRLLHSEAAPDWQRYIADDIGKGITSLRCAALGGWGGTPGAKTDSGDYWAWNDPWPGGIQPDHSRFDLRKFQTADERLAWLLDTYPDMQVQLILIGLKGYGGDGTGAWWAALPAEVRQATLRYMLARWAAFPNVFWLLVNDMTCTAKQPLNLAFAREAGSFIAAHDPWHHLLSVGPVRRAGFAFTTEADRAWCSYVHLEDANAVGAQTIDQRGLTDDPRHIFMAEDYYEQDHGSYDDPRFFFRWLLWSWTLAGGSANYGGRWGTTDPYSLTNEPGRVWVGWDGTYTGVPLTGLDSVPYLKAYFVDRKLDLSAFEPADGLAVDLDGRDGTRRPKVTRRGTQEFLIYHPNAAADSYRAKVQNGTARLRLDLTRAPGRFDVEWFRALDGVAQAGQPVDGGAPVELAAPWPGQDVVVRLRQAGAAP